MKYSKEKKKNVVWLHSYAVTTVIKLVGTKSRQVATVSRTQSFILGRWSSGGAFTARGCVYHRWAAHLKMGKMVSFTWCIFYHKKKLPIKKRSTKPILQKPSKVVERKGVEDLNKSKVSFVHELEDGTIVRVSVQTGPMQWSPGPTRRSSKPQSTSWQNDEPVLKFMWKFKGLRLAKNFLSRFLFLSFLHSQPWDQESYAPQTEPARQPRT